MLPALQGAQATAAAIVRADGIRGLYRGFGTTIFGLVPARGVSSALWFWQWTTRPLANTNHSICGRVAHGKSWTSRFLLCNISWNRPHGLPLV